MTDMFSREHRSRIMARIPSHGNVATELRFIEVLRNHKVAGWRRGCKLPGRPDFVFPAQKLAVFIDGDFWHGNPREFRLPKSNLGYWREKILGNRRRDRRVSRTLRSRGWSVYRFWQSSLKNESLIVARLRRRLTNDIRQTWRYS
jgi:DNA mismatch endonuclease (patch repair protein)